MKNCYFVRFMQLNFERLELRMNCFLFLFCPSLWGGNCLESNLFHWQQIWIDIQILKNRLAILIFFTIYFHFSLSKYCLCPMHWIHLLQLQSLHFISQSRIQIQKMFIKMFFLQFCENFISLLLLLCLKLLRNIQHQDKQFNQELQNYFSLK